MGGEDESSATSPAIFFLSDYGTADEFVGVVHAVLHRLAPLVPVIDLSHQITPFDVAGGSALLARCAPYLGPGVVLAVVDPGVGTDRRAVAVRTGPSPPAPPGQVRRTSGPTWLVGPDNGLLTKPADLFGGTEQAFELRSGGRGPNRRAGGADGSGPTFDGRDVFAPAAAHLVLGRDPSLLGVAVDTRSLVTQPSGPDGRGEGEPPPHGSAVTVSVASIDRFGNVQLILLPGVLDAIGVPLGAAAEVTVHAAPGTSLPPGEPAAPDRPARARRVVAFGDLGPGEPGLLVDSSGRMALVLDRASAAQSFGLTGTGASVVISPAPRRGR